MKTPELFWFRLWWCWCGVSIVSFKQIWHIVPVCPLLTLNKYHSEMSSLAWIQLKSTVYAFHLKFKDIEEQ